MGLDPFSVVLCMTDFCLIDKNVGNCTKFFSHSQHFTQKEPFDCLPDMIRGLGPIAISITVISLRIIQYLNTSEILLYQRYIIAVLGIFSEITIFLYIVTDITTCMHTEIILIFSEAFTCRNHKTVPFH